MTLHSRIAELRQDNEQPKILSLTFGERYWQERATALADDCEKLLEKVGAFIKSMDREMENRENEQPESILKRIVAEARSLRQELGIE